MAQEKKTERIAISELNKNLDSGERFLWIDVREDWELEKDVELVFYCGSGGRASRAAEKFAKAGYRAGKFCDIRDWKKEGQAVVEKVDRPAEGSIRP